MEKRKQASAQQRLRGYLLGTFHVFILLMPVVLALWLFRFQRGDIPPGKALLFLLAFTIASGMTAFTLQSAVDYVVDGRALRSWILPTFALSIAASIAAGIWSVGNQEQVLQPLAATLIMAACALTPLLSTPLSAALSFLVAAVLSGFAWVLGAWGDLPFLQRLSATVLSVSIPMVVIAAAMIMTARWSVVLLKSVQDQAQMDYLRADLAVAEERLRIARDMHDILGRTLTAVALKSDLAAAFSDSGANIEAAKEAREIHDLADESLAEMRGVLAGYRRSDLASELIGAQSLLESAGVHTRIVGDTDAIPIWANEPLSWVLREAATNIVRHSAATSAMLVLHVTDESAELRISNDGVQQTQESSTTNTDGSGLTGLASRLGRVGGKIGVVISNDKFTVEATVEAPRVAGQERRQ